MLLDFFGDAHDVVRGPRLEQTLRGVMTGRDDRFDLRGRFVGPVFHAAILMQPSPQRQLV